MTTRGAPHRPTRTIRNDQMKGKPEMRSTRRIAFGLTAALAAGALMTGCTGAPPSEEPTPDAELTPISFVLDVNVLPKHSMFFAAVEKGFFEAEGLDVEIVPGTGSLNAATAVDTGAADFGFGDFSAMVGGRANGADVKQLLSIHMQSPFAIVTTADAGIEDWDDLRGKKIAGEPVGTVTVLLPLALERVGIEESEVTVVPVDGTAKVPGLLAGQWDATVGFNVSDPAVMVGLGVEPVTLNWSDIGFEMYSAGIIGSDKMIEENPDLVEKFVRGVARGIKWTCDNQDEAAKIMVDEVPEMTLKAAQVGTEAACGILWVEESEQNGLGYMTDAGVQAVLDITTEFFGLEENDSVVGDYYTNAFNPGIKPSEKVTAP